MTREESLANLLSFLAVCALGLLVWRKLVLPNLRDSLRHRLFELRHEMFIFMVNGGVSADEPAYGHVRSSMNGWIRFAGSLSFFRMLTLGICARAEVGVRIALLQRDMARLDPKAREAISEFVRQAGKAVVTYVVASSALAWVMLPLLSLAFIIAAVVTRAWSTIWDSAFCRIGAEGEVLGHLEGDLPTAVAA